MSVFDAMLILSDVAGRGQPFRALVSCADGDKLLLESCGEPGSQRSRAERTFTRILDGTGAARAIEILGSPCGLGGAAGRRTHAAHIPHAR